MNIGTHGRVVVTNLVVLPWLFAMMAIFFSPIAYGSVSKCYVSGGGPFPRACPGHYRYEYCVSAECTNGRLLRGCGFGTKEGLERKVDSACYPFKYVPNSIQMCNCDGCNDKDNMKCETNGANGGGDGANCFVVICVLLILLIISLL